MTTDKKRKAPRRPKYPRTYQTVIEADAEGHFEAHLERARSGSKSSAIELLHGYCHFAHRGAIPKAIREYLALAFCEYLAGTKTIEKALLLQKPSSRPKGTTAVNPVEAVAKLYLLIKRHRIGKEAAKQQLEGRGIPKRNLERYDADWGKVLETFSVAELEVIEGGLFPPEKKG